MLDAEAMYDFHFCSVTLFLFALARKSDSFKIEFSLGKVSRLHIVEFCVCLL